MESITYSNKAGFVTIYAVFELEKSRNFFVILRNQVQALIVRICFEPPWPSVGSERNNRGKEFAAYMRLAILRY